jgi:hypothetical protein
MHTLAVPLLLFAVGDEPVKPLLPVGKDTTVVSGPVDKHGHIDYEAALNERLGKGVKPETNANVLLWKALGPKPEGGNGMPEPFFKLLGIDEPPEGGEYFVDFTRFSKEVLQVEPEDLQQLWNNPGWAGKRVWVEKDYPDVAAWLKANEKPLAVVHEAVKRPHYFNPICSRRDDGKPSCLLACLLPNVQKCREIGTALCARAMLKLGSGKPEEAWVDILACHRLARHVGRGACLVEALVGYALHAIACNATVAHIERADLTGKQWLAKLKEFQELPPMPALADKIDLGERFMGLDSVQLVRSGRDFVEKPGGKLTPEDLKALAAIDWTIPLRTLNSTYDRMVAAGRLKDRAARSKAFDELEADLALLVKKKGERDLMKLVTQAGAGKAAGTQIGAVLVGLLAPVVRKVQDAADRTEQFDRNTRVALALAAYKQDHRGYPEKLADLAPKYLARVPGDLFSGKPLIYARTADGYTFHSVGPNGKDDEGRWFDDDPKGDDPGVRLPLPPLKKE